MKPFEYFEPKTVEEASSLLYDGGKNSQILAGGIDLIPRIRKGTIKAERVINIQNIEGLEHITADTNGGVTFGAMAKLRSLEVSGIIQQKYPILYESIHQITSVQTKHMGTAVGNLCVATPASDVATSLFALGAQLKISGPAGDRTEAIERFYVGYRLTCLKQGEFVTGVILPEPSPGEGTGFINLVRTLADIAKLIVTASVVVQEGICREARIAIGAAGPTVFRAKGAEVSITGQKMTPDVLAQTAHTAAAETKPITDFRSTAEYRNDMTKVLIRRVLEQAAKRVRP
jgi:aerobic carbon-monoxide dehydrogenase medium subunit